MNYLQAIFVCAVDTFILISGYFLCKINKRDLWKPLELILQVILFKLGAYLASIVIVNHTFKIKSFVGCFIPSNYFVILYVTLYIISPFINILIEHINNKGFTIFLFTVLSLFSIWPTIVDILSGIKGSQFIGLSTIGILGSQSGYTIINFMLMYIIGAWIKRNETTFRIKKALILFLLTSFIIMLINIIEENIGIEATAHFSHAYFNPLVISQAILIFIIFKEYKFGFRKWINKLAEGTFSVFLFHGNLLKFLKVNKNMVNLDDINYLLRFIFSIFILYFASYTVYLIYNFITKPIFIRLKQHIHLPVIDTKMLCQE